MTVDATKRGTTRNPTLEEALDPPHPPLPVRRRRHDLLGVLLIGMHGLPAFGDYHGIYGAAVEQIELPARHATDYVTALNFDMRAFDTLGEEFILFASVTGVALLFRHIRQEEGREPKPRAG